MWRLRLLGGFEIDDGRRCLRRLHSRAAVLLLARLALRPARDHGREELAALLWPQVDLVTGLARLRQTLSTLRAALERQGGLQVSRPLLAADRRVLRLLPGALECDVWAFERASAAGAAHAALACYGGELLPGYYDDWLVEERMRLQALAERMAPSAGPRPWAAVAAPGGEVQLLADPPALGERMPLPAQGIEHTLPMPLGHWHGDAALIDDLVRAVDRQALTTLRGAGGIGKTRLALELLQRLARQGARFDALRFVSCIQVQGVAALHERLLESLRPPLPQGDAVGACVAALAGRRALLVLDNVDALDDEAGRCLLQLLAQVPGLRLLLTSRRVLGLPGEVDHPVAPLPLPPADAPLAELGAYAAVHLFVECAQASRADFQLHAGNAGAVASLVRRLQGLPLALELAAARVRSLPPGAMLELLAQPGSQRWTLLARHSARAGQDPRHASLLAVVDESLASLSPPARRLLEGLAAPPRALAGDLIAEFGVAAGIASNTAAARLALDELVASSLVDAVADDGSESCWALREPVRDRVLEAPSLVPPQAWWQAVQSWAERLREPWPLPRLAPLWPLLSWMAQREDAQAAPAQVLQLALTLTPAWAERVPPVAFVQALDRALAEAAPDGGDAPAQAELGRSARALAARLALALGQREAACRHAEAAAAAWPAQVQARARAQWQVAKVRWRAAGDVAAARELLEEAVQSARIAGDAASEAEAVNQLATMANEVDGDVAAAERGYRRALALLQDLQPQPLHAMRGLRHNIAIALIHAEQPQQALALIEPLIEEAQACGDEQLLAPLYNALGSATQDLGQLPEAMAATLQSLELAWAMLDREAVLYALWNLALLAHRRGLAEPAARLLGFADHAWRTQFGPLARSDRRDVLRVRRACRQRLRPALAEAIWREGQALSLPEAVARARRLRTAGAGT